MKVSEAMEQFRRIVHDISDEYDDYQIIMRLNSAAQLAGSLLAQINSPIGLREATFRDGDTLPGNFLRTAGAYPVKRTGQTVQFLEDVEEMAIRYYVTPQRIEKGADDMPFVHDALNDFVVRTACKYALNRNEFDISQDQGLMQELQTALAAAMGATEWQG